MTCQNSNYQAQMDTGSSSVGGWIALAIVAVMFVGFGYIKRGSLKDSFISCLQRLPAPIASRVEDYQVIFKILRFKNILRTNFLLVVQLSNFFKFSGSKFNFPNGKFQFSKWKISNFNFPNGKFPILILQMENLQFQFSKWKVFNSISNFNFPNGKFPVSIFQMENFLFHFSKWKFSNFNFPNGKFPISMFQMENFNFPNGKFSISNFNFPFQFSIFNL